MLEMRQSLYTAVLIMLLTAVNIAAALLAISTSVYISAVTTILPKETTAGTTTIPGPTPTANRAEKINSLLILPADTTTANSFPTETNFSTSSNSDHGLGALGIAGIGVGMFAVALFVFSLVWHGLMKQKARREHMEMTGGRDCGDVGEYRLPPPTYYEAVGAAQ